jgi:hypothetical protein
MTKSLEDYQSPNHKVLALLHKGRDKLRVKYRAVREELRVAQNQARAVEASRANWRLRAEEAERELSFFKKGKAS